MEKIEIIFEDSDILVVNKKAGIVVNRANTTKVLSTLQDWAETKINKNIDNNESEFVRRGGIVHRLDKETSGLLIIAKNEVSFNTLQSQFKDRKVTKQYIALVHGKVAENGKIDGKIARVGSFGKFGINDSGRESETKYEIQKVYEFKDTDIDNLLEKNELNLNKNRVKYLKHHGKEYTLINVFPKTGRTHQIRVHMKSIGHPLVADLIYGPSKLLKFDLLWCPRLFLHAQAISFTHPISRKLMTFKAEIPQDLFTALSNF